MKNKERYLLINSFADCTVCKRRLEKRVIENGVCQDCHGNKVEIDSWLNKIQNAEHSLLQGFDKAIRNVPQRKSARFYYVDRPKIRYFDPSPNFIKIDHDAKCDWHIKFVGDYRINLLIGKRLVIRDVYDGVKMPNFKSEEYIDFCVIKIHKGEVCNSNKSIFTRNIPKEIALQGFNAIRDFLTNSNFANKKEKASFKELFEQLLKK